jgi:hypothetical protein
MKYIFVLLCVLTALWLHFGCARSNVFQEPPDHPAIDSIAPARGKVGTQIRLYGTGFSTHSSQNSVSVNGMQVRVDSPSISTVVLATITAVTGTGHVNITVGGKEAGGPIFTYDTNAISINSISPASGWVDTTVTIRGVGFGLKQDSAKVSFNGHPATIKKFSDTLIVVLAPASATNSTAGTAIVMVTVSGRKSNTVEFVYATGLKPVITKVGFGWYQENGYSINVTNLAADDNRVQLFINRAPITLAQIVRPGRPRYDPVEGDQLLIYDADMKDHTSSIYDSLVVVCNGIASDVYVYQMKPVIDSITSRRGGHQFAPGDTMTIRGNFFGDRTLPSSFEMFYLGLQLSPAPTVLSWKNTEIIIVMPAYSVLPVGTNTHIAVIVGQKISNGWMWDYLGTPAVTGTVTTLAGGTQGYADGQGSAAAFNGPRGMVTDAQGNIYVADRENQRIRKITPNGTVSTYAGSGVYGYRDGPAATAQFKFPEALAIDAQGNLYTCELSSHCIRKITPAGMVTTFAGDTASGYVDGIGHAARFYAVEALVTDVNDNLYVAEQGSLRIRKITPDGTVTTYAGNGTQGHTDGPKATASFGVMAGIAIDKLGNMYVSEYYPGSRIRKITPGGIVSSLAGGDATGYVDGSGAAARFQTPYGMAADVNNNIYVVDGYNYRIRKIAPDGTVSTLAGSGVTYSIDGALLQAGFSGMYSLATDSQGNIYASDGHRIRKITLH